MCLFPSGAHQETTASFRIPEVAKFPPSEIIRVEIVPWHPPPPRYRDVQRCGILCVPWHCRHCRVGCDKPPLLPVSVKCHLSVSYEAGRTTVPNICE